jgi:hypothetical protein
MSVGIYLQNVLPTIMLILQSTIPVLIDGDIKGEYV